MNNVIICRWPSVFTHAELHGAHIEYNQDGSVFYSSPLLPPGTSVYIWKSYSKFDADRCVPTLPLLEYKKTYRITNKMEDNPVGSTFLKVTLYDNHNHIIHESILDSSGGEFYYFPGTIKYDIQLVVKSNESINFNSMIISESQMFENIDVDLMYHSKIVTLFPNQFDQVVVYIGRRESGTWSIPVENKKASIFLRCEFNYSNSNYLEFFALRLKKILKDHEISDESQFSILPLGYPMDDIIDRLMFFIKK